MSEGLLKAFDRPDEVREFPHGRFEIIHIAGITLGRATYQPGWKWSIHNAPSAGTTLCHAPHTGTVLSGHGAVLYEDGRYLDLQDSWVRQGPNKPLHRDQVEAAIEPETLEELSRETGLTREELLERIAKDLPEAVDTMTPNGRLPEEGSAMAAEPTLLDDVPPRRQ